MSVRNLKVMPLPILSCDLGNRNSIFSLKFQLCMCAKLFQLLANSATLWTLGSQNPLSNGFSTQKYWSGLPFPSPGDHPHPGIEPASPVSPAFAGRFFTTEPAAKTIQAQFCCVLLSVLCSYCISFLFFF